MPAERRAISSGSPFEDMAGYARAHIDGDWVFVSGTAGPDPVTGALPPDPVAQARNALAIIAATLAQAECGWADVVQVRVFLASRDPVVEVSRLLGALFSDPRPTNTTLICGFPDARILVEIEMVARRHAP